MASEYDTKEVLLNLSKEGENRNLSYGNFFCLTCSGVHRSLGVHLSFVRSITMDKWSEAQVQKMVKGGNQKCREFFEQGPDYRKGMSIEEKYNTWTAAQYRDKLSAEVEGRPWDPSMTPKPAPVDSGASAGLRKPRAGISSKSPSPAPSRPMSPGAMGGAANPYSGQKAQNETFFAGLGATNASRPEGLAPSQGGKYAGFGSQSDYVPAQSTSSKALPSLDDVKADPMAALSRGWGFFSSAVQQASKEINQSIIQPGYERATDPNFRSQLQGYANTGLSALSEAGKQGQHALSGAMKAGGDMAKRNGYDVGDMGASYIDKLQIGGSGRGAYANPNSTEALNREENGQADFFESHLSSETMAASNSNAPLLGNSPSLAPAARPGGRASPAPRKKPAAKDTAWDDFDDSSWAKND